MAGGDGWGFKVRRELVLLCNFENLIDLWTCMYQRKKKNSIECSCNVLLESWRFFFCVLFYYFDIFMPLKSKNILKINRYYNVKSCFMNYTCEMWAYEGDISWTKKRFHIVAP